MFFQSNGWTWLIAFCLFLIAENSYVLADEPANRQELLARIISAETGKTNWESIQSYRSVSTRSISLAGKLSVKTREMLEIDLPHSRWRLNASEGRDQVRVTIGDSKRTAIYKKINGKTVGSSDTLAGVPFVSESRKLLVQFESTKFESTPIGTKEKYTFHSEDGMFEWLYDSTSLLLAKKVEKTDYGQAVTVYSDYRNVGGLMLPFQLKTTVKDASYVVEQQFESIELNAIIDETAFDFDDTWQKIKVGERIPDFVLADAFVEGKKWSRESLRGCFALIDFWATWCGPCIAEFPTLKEVQNKFKDQGFCILAISLDSDEEQYRRFVRERIPEWGNVLVQDGFDSDLAVQFELSSVPRSILVDPEGIIIAIDENARGPKLIELLERCLSAKK